jgi:4'-phosphopantetheinyl transferase
LTVQTSDGTPGALPSSWSSPPAELALAKGEVHVWRAALDRSGGVRERLTAKLSNEERGRAERIAVVDGRERWVVGRGLLRVVLGRYLNIAPEAVAIRTDPAGKPRLAGEADSRALSFNVSHSGSLALFAVSGGARLGVDVQEERELDADQIARRWFSPAEREALEALPQADRRAAFFSCWSRKEAFAKAVGQGLLLSLSSFTVSVGCGGQPELISPPQGHGSQWTLWDLAPGAGFAGAVAVEGASGRLQCFDLTEREAAFLRGEFPRPG